MCEGHAWCASSTTIWAVDVQRGLQETHNTQHDTPGAPSAHAPNTGTPQQPCKACRPVSRPHSTPDLWHAASMCVSAACHSIKQPKFGDLQTQNNPPAYLLQGANELQATPASVVAYGPHHARRLAEQEDASIGVAHHVGQVRHLKVRRDPALTLEHAGLCTAAGEHGQQHKLTSAHGLAQPYLPASSARHLPVHAACTQGFHMQCHSCLPPHTNRLEKFTPC